MTGGGPSLSDPTIASLCIVLHLIPIALLATIWLLCLPLTMVKLTLITSIEMMKDPALIEKVISEQKILRAKRSQRIFQVMKLIRRELAEELRKQIQDKRLRGVTKKHIVESFQQLGGQRTKTVKGDAIKSLIKMCGQVLNKQEERILLKKSHTVSSR
jgi:hypothetical protein